jgi:putative nucleotidyltransferase with HDIG domain
MASELILIVEGDPTRAKALALILGDIGGYAATTTPTVLAALRQVQTAPFKLILINTTVQVPNDGIKLAKLLLLRVQKPKRPLTMMVTLEASKHQVQQCARAGVIDYLVYPYDPPALLQRVRSALSQREDLSEDQMRKGIMESLEQILDLPTISKVYTQIEELTKGKDTSADDVARVIEVDQAITAKLLRLSNSAFFGFARRIGSVKEAVALIGFESVRAAVTAVTTFDALGRIKESPHFNRKAFWEHSIGCGVIARFLARKFDMDPDQAFVAGLMHDIGKVILDGYFPDEFAMALKRADEKNLTIFEAERDVLPVTHEDVGRHLAERWNLPEPLIEVIGAHNSLSVEKGAHARLVHLAHLADARCRALSVGRAGDDIVVRPEEAALKQFGVTGAGLVDWRANMEAEIQKAQSILNLV